MAQVHAENGDIIAEVIQQAPVRPRPGSVGASQHCRLCLLRSRDASWSWGSRARRDMRSAARRR